MENDSRMALFVADLKALIRKWEVPHGEQPRRFVPHTRLESGSISNTGEVVDYSVNHSVRPGELAMAGQRPTETSDKRPLSEQAIRPWRREELAQQIGAGYEGHQRRQVDYTITKEMCDRLVQKLAEKDRL